MPIEHWSEQVSVLHLADDPQFTDDLEAALNQLATQPVDMVLDFAAVHLINSSNLARLLRLRTSMLEAEKRLIVCNANTQVWTTMLVTGLDKIFVFSESVTTALASLQMGVDEGN
jgi:anti-anti-sigma factor